jgi:hypothetical protein
MIEALIISLLLWIFCIYLLLWIFFDIKVLSWHTEYMRLGNNIAEAAYVVRSIPQRGIQNFQGVNFTTLMNMVTIWAEQDDTRREAVRPLSVALDDQAQWMHDNGYPVPPWWLIHLRNVRKHLLVKTKG